MQKKLIALAVAGLVSGAASAQSNVTFYGIADVGYVYDSDSFTAGTKSKSQIYSGNQSGSRFGFRGEEDLGNGLKANFRMEAGVMLDSGYSDQQTAAQFAANQNGILFGRWSTVGLSGDKWGSVEAGRRETFIEQAVTTANVMKNATVAQVTPVFQRVQRYDNFVAYATPVWNGLQLKAGFSSNMAGQDVNPAANTLTTQSATNNVRVYALAATYTNGGLFLAATYDYNKYQSIDNTQPGVAGYDAGDSFYLVGAYDFGVARVNAGYAKINYAQNKTLAGASDAAKAQEDRNQWQIGVSVPITKADLVALNYAHGTTHYNNLQPTWGDDTSSIWGVMYQHDLSKRTNVYAAYGDISQNSGNHQKVSIDNAANSSYQKALSVGFRHQF